MLHPKSAPNRWFNYLFFFFAFFLFKCLIGFSLIMMMCYFILIFFFCFVLHLFNSRWRCYSAIYCVCVCYHHLAIIVSPFIDHQKSMGLNCFGFFLLFGEWKKNVKWNKIALIISWFLFLFFCCLWYFWLKRRKNEREFIKWNGSLIW